MTYPRPGEVWYIELEDTRGHEQSGDRPAVVLARSYGMYTVILFTTSEKGFDFPHTHPVQPDSRNGLSQLSFAMCFQVLAIDEERCLRKLGSLSQSDLECIKDLLKDLLVL